MQSVANALGDSYALPVATPLQGKRYRTKQTLGREVISATKRRWLRVRIPAMLRGIVLLVVGLCVWNPSAPQRLEVRVLQEAQAAAVKITDASERAEALREIAVVRAEAGQFEQALQTAQQIEDTFWLNSALAGIAKVQAQAG